MHPDALRDLHSFIVEAGLTGVSENDILAGCCQRLSCAGVALSRGTIIIDTLHPVHEGRLFRWRADGNTDGDMMELGRTSHDPLGYAAWLRSPFHHLLTTGGTMLRRRLVEGGPDDFAVLAELREQGVTDYLVLCAHFTEAGRIGEMDCVHASWMSDAPEGFSHADVELLAAFYPSLALALKCASILRITHTLMDTYLGRDAGRRVLEGRIERGVAERMRAVIWFSDLRSYTRISDSASPEAIMPFLNDYSEAVISAVHDAGGDVLKLIGDGTLAIFRADDDAVACGQALSAEAEARKRIAELNARRASEGLPVSDIYVGLHVGDVFYGNIGSQDRLDFTVIGPAVNMASRVAAMCRSADRAMLMSTDFVRAVPREQARDLVSVGRYGLRGIERAEELFTRIGADPTSA